MARERDPVGDTYQQDCQPNDETCEDSEQKRRASNDLRLSKSRRDFLKAGTAITGVSAFGLSLTDQVEATTRIKTESNGGMLNVDTNFSLIDNQWGNPDAQQGVWVNDDGSYGWDFDASGTKSGINYPEVFIGTRPWGSDTGVPEFPIQRGDVTEYVLDVQTDSNISGGEWDFAHEWWLMEQRPSVQTKTYQYEIMLLLDWGGGHDHGSPVYTDLWTDEYGNTIDLWALYNSGGTSATFYIFRIQGGHDGGKINMKRIVDWLTSHEDIREDLWISGSELGNEYWPGAVGSTTVNEFTVTVNGSTYTSGKTNRDTTAPSTPSNLSSSSYDSSSVTLVWDAAVDSVGSVDHYNVYVDGSTDHQVAAGTTSTTVSGLSPATSYNFSVTAVDAAGNESQSSNTISITTENGNSDSNGIQSGLVYRIKNKNSGQVLDVSGGSTSNGTSLLQWPWHDKDNQRWKLIENGDGTYRLKNENSGKVADIDGGSTDGGADALQWWWHGGDNQRWKLIENDDGTYRIENENSGLVLDVSGGSTSNGANVIQWWWHGGDNQRWVLTQDNRV